MEQAKRPLTLGRFFREYFVYLLPSAFLIYIVLESYQIDFRPYYVAGKLVLFGMDPYLNYVTTYPSLYTPVNANDAPWSGFIYPPLATFLFVPLAIFPYTTAKVIFSSVILVLLWLLLYRLLWANPETAKPDSLLLVLFSFPVLAAFERGQIDILICLLTVLSFQVYPRQWGMSAFLLAVATSLKIFPGILLLYYLIRRDLRQVGLTLAFIGLFFVAPLPYFGSTVYQHYGQRILPSIFGPLAPPTAVMDLHGQKVVDRVVKAFDGNGLRVTQDFVHGYMNPFLRHNLAASVAVGTVCLLVLLYFRRKDSADVQFYSILNVINICNRQAWIMGLIWYAPFFIYAFGRANHRGKFLLALPLLMPPFTNSNAMLAYAVTLAFAIPGSRKHLELTDQNLSQRELEVWEGGRLN